MNRDIQKLNLSDDAMFYLAIHDDPVLFASIWNEYVSRNTRILEMREVNLPDDSPKAVVSALGEDEEGRRELFIFFYDDDEESESLVFGSLMRYANERRREEDLLEPRFFLLLRHVSKDSPANDYGVLDRKITIEYDENFKEKMVAIISAFHLLVAASVPLDSSIKDLTRMDPEEFSNRQLAQKLRYLRSEEGIAQHKDYWLAHPPVVRKDIFHREKGDDFEKELMDRLEGISQRVLDQVGITFKVKDQLIFVTKPLWD